MPTEFVVKEGTCRPLFVFDVGFAIDLDSASRQVWPVAERPVLQHRERSSGPFDYRPAPLRIPQDLGGATVPPFTFGPAAELVLYDFGAASLSYTIPLPSSPAEVLALSIALRGHTGLIADARRRVTSAVASLGEAIHRPRVADLVEDYFLFELVAVEGVEDGASFCAHHADWIARVLRAEPADLSADEIRDATQARLSYSPRDLILVDWDSAIILDPEPGNLRAVLEFANVQLLELRHLDNQMDQILERSYQMLSRRAGWRSIALTISAEERRRLSSLQIDSAVLLERVTNALKFLGEEYLARLYRIASGRLHLAEWDGVITRKLAIVESIYQKLGDRATARRMELLEWVIILLIALEVVLSLVS